MIEGRPLFLGMTTIPRVGTKTRADPRQLRRVSSVPCSDMPG